MKKVCVTFALVAFLLVPFSADAEIYSRDMVTNAYGPVVTTWYDTDFGEWVDNGFGDIVWYDALISIEIHNTEPERYMDVDIEHPDTNGISQDDIPPEQQRSRSLSNFRHLSGEFITDAGLSVGVGWHY